MSEGGGGLGRKGTAAVAEPLAQPLCGGFSLHLRAEAGAGDPAAEGSLLAPGVKKAGPRG